MSRRASGLRAWIVQRVSAVYMVIAIVYLVGFFYFAEPLQYFLWRDFATDPLYSIGLALLMLSVLMHAWVGMRDVLVDYIHPAALRLSLLTLLALFLIGCGFWALRILMLAFQS